MDLLGIYQGSEQVVGKRFSSARDWRRSFRHCGLGSGVYRQLEMGSTHTPGKHSGNPHRSAAFRRMARS